MSRSDTVLPYRAQEGHGARNRGESVIVIANPRAGGGRAGAERNRVEGAVNRAFEHGQVWWTSAPGHATELARKAAVEADLVVALGGDGTAHEVVAGLFDRGVAVNRKVIFSVVPFGTGGDLVRSLEIPQGLDAALWVCSTGMTLPLDVGRLDWPDGRIDTFINVAGFGANAEVCRLANASSKRWGGRLTFVGAILRTLQTYTPVPVRWSWEGPDGAGSVEMDTLAAFCANGHYCGAGLWVGRGGDMTDGLFELTLIPSLTALRAASLLPKAYAGRFDGAPGVVRVRAHRVEVASPVPIETDGEVMGSGPAVFSVLPRALQVRGGWLRPPGTLD